MSEEAQQSTSSWMDTAQTPTYSSLSQNLRADVCVVGGGIAGLTTAYLLAREGRSVVVLESGGLGSGQTGRTTAHLSSVVDDRYSEVERLHGSRAARLVAHSHRRAIDRIEGIVRDEGIECDFERVDGYLFAPPGGDTETLDEELAAARRAGLTEAEHVERAPINEFNTGPALRFPHQGQFHPLKYLNGLAQAITSRGGHIFTNTHVIKVRGGQTSRILTDRQYVVTARAVVVATNSPISDRIAIHTKQEPYRTYVIAAQIPVGSVHKALYWDTLDPYHYVRLENVAAQDGQEAYDLLIVGGEDHKTGEEDDGEERYARLEEWTRYRFPMVKEVKYWWSGQVMEPVDGLAFIGQDLTNGNNVYIATGDSGMGMTHSTIAGILLTDLIQGRKNPWASLYDPGRITPKAAPDFLKAGLDVVSNYGEWFSGGDVDSTTDIPAGSGAIVRRGIRKIAAYRDENGQLHTRSAVCPHLGCIVAWNSTENGWDCPCHGSQFDAYGHVLEGPSIADLNRVDD